MMWIIENFGLIAMILGVTAVLTLIAEIALLWDAETDQERDFRERQERLWALEATLNYTGTDRTGD